MSFIHTHQHLLKDGNHRIYYEAWRKMHWLGSEIGVIVQTRAAMEGTQSLRPLMGLKWRLERLLCRPESTYECCVSI